MEKEKELLIVEISLYIIQNNATVRDASKKFNISKSSVHRYMVKDLPIISSSLATMVNESFERNKQLRTIRGGEATRKKYLSLNN